MNYFYPLLISLALALGSVSCKKTAFKTSAKTEAAFHVKNNDYLIPVMVRGNTASGKIILFIQGGPGYASLDFAQIDYPDWKNTLEKDYAIAYYDQRGTGNRQGNFTQGDLALNTWIEDLHAVATFLQKAYNAQIIMMGHSFGGGLMYRYMHSKGKSAAAVKYIAVDAPVTTDADTDTLRWNFRREFLQTTANLEISRGKRLAEWNEVLEWLKANPKIRKIEGSNPYKLMNEWNAYVEKLVYADYPEKPVKARDYMHITFASNYNPLTYFNGAYTDKLATRILREEKQDFLTAKLQQIPDLPLLIIGGRFDDICPPEENAYVFQQLQSKQKTLAIIDYAGHTPFTNQPDVFYTTVKQFVTQ